MSKESIERVWERALPVSGHDPDIWRKDECGAWVNRNDYGRRSYYGWLFDPASLIPLNWENYEVSSEGAQLICVVTAAESEGGRSGHRLSHCFLG